MSKLNILTLKTKIKVLKKVRVRAPIDRFFLLTTLMIRLYLIENYENILRLGELL